ELDEAITTALNAVTKKDIWKRGTKEAKQFLIVAHFDDINNLCRVPNEQRLLKEAVLNCLNPLSQRLHDPNEFIKIVKIWSEQRPGIRLLLVIDQFEELITLSSHSKEDKQNQQPNLTESQQFLKLLQATLAAKEPQLSIVITLRSDFEPRFLNSEALKSYWTHARFPVRAMRSDELRQAIERPAAEMALYFEQLPGQRNPVDKLVDEMGQMPGALPLLSFTLSELYIKLAKKWETGETSDRALTLDAEFDFEGGVAGSLTQRANKEYDSLPDDAHRDTMRRVMLRMVTVENGVSARRRVPLSELVYADKHDPSKRDDKENKRVELVVKRLIEARLVVSGQETGEPYVEPAHDFLVKSWDQLQKWQQKEQEDLLLLRRLTPSALEWKNKEQSASVLGKAEPVLSWFDKKIDFGEDWFNKIKKNAQERQLEKKRQFLWNGNPYLDVLRKKLKSVDYWFNQVETEFVQQSVWQRRRNVNLRWSIAIGVTVVSLSLTAWALSNLRQAIIQQISADKNSTETAFRANQLTLEALISSLRAGKSLKSLLVRRPFQPDQQWQNQVLTTLQKAVYQVKELNRWRLPQGQVRDIFLGQDDKVWIAVSTVVKTNDGHQDDVISLWDSKTQQVTKLALGKNSGFRKSVSFSPDGSQLAIVGRNETIHLCGLESKHCEELLKVPGFIESVSFSRDGKSLALIISNKERQRSAYLWNLQSREGLKKLAEYSETQGITVKHIMINGKDIMFKGITEKDIMFSSDGYHLVKISRDNLHFSDYSSEHDLGVTVRNVSIIPTTVDDVILSPDSKKMVTTRRKLSPGISKLCVIDFWDLSSSQDNSTQQSKPFTEACSANFNPRNNQLAIGGRNGDISFYDYNNQKSTEWKAHEGAVWSVRFSSDGKQLITIGEDGTIRLWSTQEWQSSLPSLPIDKKIESISVSPNGQQIALTDSQGATSLWDLSHQTLTSLPITEGSFTSVIFTPDGKHFAGAKKDNTITVFDIYGKLIYLNKFELHRGNLKDMIFRKDGRLFIIIYHDKDYAYSYSIVDFSNNPKLFENPVERGLYIGYTFSPKGLPRNKITKCNNDNHC
ncbi:WD40 repeat domain-containing protein, partial [uncultured Nostoc sp.]|uniref:WD40 repeat domain-containing protein n=1 Tax=uncultured Nostoc sp. TaxID=340711 RepID=UPI0035CC08F6